MIKQDLIKKSSLSIKNFILYPNSSFEFEEFTDPAFYTRGVEQYWCLSIEPHYVTDIVLKILSAINPNKVLFKSQKDLNYFYLIDKINSIKNISIINSSNNAIQIVLTNANIRMVNSEFYIMVIFRIFLSAILL